MPEFAEQRRRLVESLRAEGLLRSDRVIAAMAKVPRELFVPENLRDYAYNDAPLPIEHGQTISAPHDRYLDVRARYGSHNG